MKATKTVIALALGTLLGTSVPALADHGRWTGNRGHDRVNAAGSAFYHSAHAPAVRPRVVQRTVVVQRPVVHRTFVHRTFVQRPVVVHRPPVRHIVARPVPYGHAAYYGAPAYAEPYRDPLPGLIGGAVIGAIIGNQVSHGPDRGAATAVGAVLGGIIGSQF